MQTPAEYNDYIKSATWKNICTLKKKEAGNKCERCGHSSVRLDVHHLTYERFKKESLGDLRVLCRSCHEIEDAKRKQEQEKRAKQRLHNARFEGYMNKKYGEGYLETTEPTEKDCEDFKAWLERKEEQELYE